MSRPLIDISGQVFGRLTVVERAPILPEYREAVWISLCECGNKTLASGSNLRSGATRSCGCLLVGRPQHGHYCNRRPSPTYISWQKMRDRCHSPNHASYSYYGGRGITVCERWNRFENFLTDMGERPEGMTLDRIDPEGNYEPDNCRWADAKTQRANRRDKRLAK